MDSESQFEKIFQQYLDLLQFTIEASETPVADIPPDIPMRLYQLEQKVNAFCKLNDALLKSQGYDPDAEAERPIELSKLTKKDKRLLERAKRLLEEAKEQTKQIREAKSQQPPQGSNKPQKEKKKSTLDHQRNFKRVGGYKHWKPL